ncbi:MAG: LUD domain-containing protein [Anaerolineales bacterium]|nr:LUD domain-containing protein [Anaerolineales bacterium]
MTWSTKLGLQMYTRLLTHPKLYAVSQKFASLGSFLLSPRSQWMRLPTFTGWGLSKDLPRFAGKPFRERWGSKQVEKYTGGQVDTKTSKQVNTDTVKYDAVPVSPVSLFTTELSALSGHVYQTKHPTQSIIEFLVSRNIQKILLEPNTLDESLLQKANIEFTYETDPQILVGVTNALCGLADTGSVLEADGALHASLLPEIHIAILKSKDILPSLSDAIDLVKDKKAAVFITGPSRTADIEMTLTIGVHGPKEIHVFIENQEEEIASPNEHSSQTDTR